MAWSEGYRFWYSAREGDEETAHMAITNPDVVLVRLLLKA